LKRAATRAVAASFLTAGGATYGQATDIELGRYLSSECMTCHGAARAEAIPNIAGMAQPIFTHALKAYRDKRRPNQVMQTVASRLSDEDIAALATYFASAKKNP
jgi:cytochrome c